MGLCLRLSRVTRRVTVTARLESSSWPDQLNAESGGRRPV